MFTASETHAANSIRKFLESLDSLVTYSIEGWVESRTFQVFRKPSTPPITEWHVVFWAISDKDKTVTEYHEILKPIPLENTTTPTLADRKKLKAAKAEAVRRLEEVVFLIRKHLHIIDE